MLVKVAPRSILSSKMLQKVACWEKSEPFYQAKCGKSGTQLHSIQQISAKSGTQLSRKMLVKVAPRSVLSSKCCEKWHPAIQQNAGKSQIRSIQQNARKKWHPDLFYQAKCQSRSIQQNASKSGTQIHSIWHPAIQKNARKSQSRSIKQNAGKSGTQIHSIKQNAIQKNARKGGT